MRFYNTGEGIKGGGEIGVPTIKRKGADGVVREYVKVPPLYSGCQCSPSGVYGRVEWDGICRCGQEKLVEHKPGNVYVPLGKEFGFFVVEKGKHFDPPPGISAKAIASIAPHLISQDEAEFEQQQAKDKKKPISPTA